MGLWRLHRQEAAFSARPAGGLGLEIDIIDVLCGNCVSSAMSRRSESESDHEIIISGS